ncbi:SusD/RagB family nutrient-binding outer membrane lipoprotein [Longimicrobium sp.]|uniref:SusD/RagB family nutrient-binding outer membrane lipoprotein n=1 Tax=Longimicrobium sp. TaxID=2029185 RepID=UPI002E33F1CB|nr:SusD/RagB family nutrient-binding outer membrane lipoprotein [Longimicrobium sp.]HEX6040245.1 SusD/RagB family nutrient-binding outer membrane lipoprotein [Longimicrobium sp.]
MRFKKMLTAVPALSLVLAAGCDDGLTDINKNPNAPEDVPVEVLLASGIWDAVDPSNGVGGFGPWTTLYHTELWAQHVAQSAYNDEDRYTPRAGIPTEIWENFYAGTLQDLLRVKEMADEADDDNLWAVAEIMSAYDFMMLTDLFGDVPYSEALSLEADIQNPKYDAQADIYPDLLRRLREAVARIDASAELSAAEGDLLYEGDMQGWVNFANSLRMRIAMRMADTPKSSLARTEFAAAWGTAQVIDDVSEQADLDWPGAQPAQNPIYEQIVLGGRPGDFRLSRALVDTLTSLADPRLAVFAQPAATDGAYRGLPNGLTPAQVGGTYNTSGSYSTIGSYFLRPETPSVLMSAAEVLLLGAEGAQRGWIAASPETLYEAGISASFEQYDVDGADAYVNQAKVTYGGLEDIWLQKWIALFMAGPEAFNEFRRTGTPNLQLSANASTETFPARIPYPQEEALYNSKNFPANVEITTPVWFMNH